MDNVLSVARCESVKHKTDDVLVKLGYEFPHRKCHERADNKSYIRTSLIGECGGAFESFLLAVTLTNRKKCVFQKIYSKKVLHCTHWPFRGILKRR